MSKWVEGKVINLRQWTAELYSVQLEAEISPFTAGQFTRIALEIDGEMVARPYSFVNGPDNPLYEFYFITVKDGPLTGELVKLNPGDPLFIAPKGDVIHRYSHRAISIHHDHRSCLGEI